MQNLIIFTYNFNLWKIWLVAFQPDLGANKQTLLSLACYRMTFQIVKPEQQYQGLKLDWVLSKSVEMCDVLSELQAAWAAGGNPAAPLLCQGRQDVILGGRIWTHCDLPLENVTTGGCEAGLVSGLDQSPEHRKPRAFLAVSGGVCLIYQMEESYTQLPD